jgi:hypothetical protein
MQDTATIIAHIMFRDGAILNIPTVLRNLDHCLEDAAQGAYSLAWDSEDVMVANFAQTTIILVAGHQLGPDCGFTLTLAISPKDMDALANPILPEFHRGLITQMVSSFSPPGMTNGVFWQRARAPITADTVEDIADAIAEQIARLDGMTDAFAAKATSIDNAHMLPANIGCVQAHQLLPH